MSRAGRDSLNHILAPLNTLALQKFSLQHMAALKVITNFGVVVKA